MRPLVNLTALLLQFYQETEISKPEFIQTSKRTIWLHHLSSLYMQLLAEWTLTSTLNQLVKTVTEKTYSLKTSGQPEVKLLLLQIKMLLLKCSSKYMTEFPREATNGTA